MPIENEDKYHTPLDVQLQNLALLDWPTFCKLIGPDNITNAKICILRRKGKSLNQIAINLSVTKRKVEVNCGKCNVFGDGNDKNSN